MTDKGLYIHKQFIQLNNNTTQLKRGRKPKQTFLQRRHTDSQKSHMKSSTLLTTREMQIKTTMRYHLTPVRMLSFKNLQITNAGEGVEKRGCAYTVGGDVNW